MLLSNTASGKNKFEAAYWQWVSDLVHADDTDPEVRAHAYTLLRRDMPRHLNIRVPAAPGAEVAA